MSCTQALLELFVCLFVLIVCICGDLGPPGSIKMIFGELEAGNKKKIQETWSLFAPAAELEYFQLNY